MKVLAVVTPSPPIYQEDKLVDPPTKNISNGVFQLLTAG